MREEALFGVEGLVERLKSVAGKHPEVVFLAVTGSIARRGFSSHDVDIAVKLCGASGKYDVLAELVGEISEALSVPEEYIDVIDLDRADPEIKAEVVRSSVIVVDRSYYGRLVREVEEVYSEYGEYRELSAGEWLRSEDPTTIDPAVVKRRLDFIRSEVDFLRGHVLARSPEEVKGSPILSRVLERSYQLIIEAMIDAARQIVSAMGWGPCFTASEYVERLAEHSVIPEGLAGEVIRRIRLRNIIIHRYLDVDYDELCNDIHKLVEIAGEYERRIADFLKRQMGRDRR